MFQRIATPLLYTIIVTDDFPSLILNIFDLASPASPLLHTRRLFIEYSDKRLEPRYFDLVNTGGHVWNGYMWRAIHKRRNAAGWQLLARDGKNDAVFCAPVCHGRL